MMKAVAAEASEERAEERAPLISRAVLWSHPSPTRAGEEKEEARGAAAEAATLSLLS